MANRLATAVQNRIPGRWKRWLLAFPLTRRFMHQTVREQDMTIATGIGQGLAFNPGRSNPAYAVGSNELPVQQVLADHLRPGDVFYDVGANVGFFTILAARLVGPAGHVYAFEPLPDNVAVLRHNIALNAFANVTLIEAAVAARPGQGELMVAHYSGGSALATLGTPPPDMKERLPVTLVSLDDLRASGTIAQAKLVKVDVEGAELAVLQGMTEMFRAHRPVIIYEIDDADAAAFQQKSRACAEFLREHGYQVTALAESYADIDWHVGHFLATESN